MERGFTLPLTPVEFWIVAAIAGLGGLILYSIAATQIEDRIQRRDRSNSERLLEIMAWLLAPIWAVLTLFLIYLIYRLGNLLLGALPAEDLRWYAFGFVGLVTSLLALVSAPLALIRVATTERQTRTAEQGHMTDRISKAVEQLGAEKTAKTIVNGKPKETTEPNLEVRIGGLLSLERIAQDSTVYDKGRDHVRVMEIICAYIRNNAPASGAQRIVHTPSYSGGVAQGGEDDEPSPKNPGAVHPWQILANLPGPREDVALAVLILSRRDEAQLKVEADKGLTNGPRAGWLFDEVLPDTSPKSLVSDADINVAMKRIGEWKRRVRGYDGYRLDLRNCCLRNADLSGFRLGGAMLEGALLDGANMTGADLRGARLFRASLIGTKLTGAQLQGSEFLGHIDGAILDEANLDGASFVQVVIGPHTVLKGASFIGAASWCADYRRSKLSSAQLAESYGDASVKLASGQAPKFWPTHALDVAGFNTELAKWRDDRSNYNPPPMPSDEPTLATPAPTLHIGA